MQSHQRQDIINDCVSMACYPCRGNSGGAVVAAEWMAGRASVRLMLSDWTTHGSHLEPSTNSSLLSTPSWFYHDTQTHQSRQSTVC